MNLLRPSVAVVLAALAAGAGSLSADRPSAPRPAKQNAAKAAR